jgi:peroxiredoxin
VSGEEPSHRLDPDRAAAVPRAETDGANGEDGKRPLQTVVDPRPYRWAIGIFGLTLVIAFSIYQLSSHGLATAGVPAGDRLKDFAAPLAISNLNGDANLTPPCTEAHHDPGALNLCLLVRRAPVVLAFFSTSSKGCVQEVDALQRVASELPAGRVQFAAVAIRASHRGTAALVRSRHWTIPVAYDRDGAVGSLYDVEICPLVELARTGGIVADRLIGNHWSSPSALAARVRSLLRG